jgi:UDPglucose 6-dehydrogenase
MNDYKVVVTKSTVPIGTGEHIRQLINERKKSRSNFGVVSNPEFLREGAALNDFMRPDRVVIGSRDEEAVAIMKDLYRPLYLIEAPFVITSLEAAELTKYAANAFLATKVSFINEIANLCEKIGCDVHDVARGIGMDKRIGSKFLHPGPGFGGSCFPKDTRALASVARHFGSDSLIVDAVIEVNSRQRSEMLAKIRNSLGSEGIFVGSESLGLEGSDHLQFFHSLDDLHALFAPYFKYIELRAIDYRAGRGPTGFMRNEGYWRCSNDRKRMAESTWTSYRTDNDSSVD